MSDHEHGAQTSPHGDWDERYAGQDRLWSGRPNEALAAEVADLAPGRALDVGCGEGADAIWLAGRGWRVCALDVSAVAVERGRAAAQAAGVAVEWTVCGLADLPPETVGAGFELVSAFYPALPKQHPGNLAGLLGAVAPGGTLLVVHHADVDREAALAHGCDPDDYLSVGEIAAALGPGWTVEAHERRPRTAAGGAGSHHTVDELLRARRS